MSDYRATYVIPGSECCAAVSAVTGQAWLLREAPQLPLTYCTRTEECACRYQKIPDRRQNAIDRRTLEAMKMPAKAGLWSAADRRRSPGRRATDFAAAV